MSAAFTERGLDARFVFVRDGETAIDRTAQFREHVASSFSEGMTGAGTDERVRGPARSRRRP
ncbi:hypothetical protein C9J85_16080 [Haloferax sp. wsp5]|nr:hypothetical protein C9J85_16080 [Haloferax sp. wsp5]